ncbi:MAG TPA: ATP-binding protein [Anaerolineales bacterium]|nr:ATP-binding protein [Anaerolineales bacterium]
MRNKTFTSRLRTWLDNLPIQDPVDRRMASLLQFILLGFIAIILIAIILNLILGSALSPQEILTSLIANSIGAVIFALPLMLLRRGYFRASVLILIAILFILSTLSVGLAMSLREANGTLFPLTLAMILAGLLVGSRALALTFGLSIGVLLLGVVLEQSTDSQIWFTNIAVAGNFILFNGLMSLFLDRFGITLRTALTAAYERESELKNVIRERELAEEKYSKIVENAIDGIFQSTPDGRFISVNPAMARMYGYESPEDMLSSVTNISTQLYVDSDIRDALQRRLANEEQIVGYESLDYRKDRSTFWTSANVQVIRDADGIILYYEGTVEDVTPRKKVEAERESLIQELAAKNAELERFTYTVSHDLKSPLVTINGFLGYLEQDAASGNMDRFKTDSQRIHAAVNKMQGMLGELLELSRIGRLVNEPEIIPFGDLVSAAMELVHGQIEAGGITVDLQPKLPAVYGDRQRLTEVLQNLLDNASKFMGDQTNPRIEIGQHGKEDGKAVFYVKDNGVGIEPDYHEHIFGLFNKLNSKAEGTGIGLALVKRIIEVHGGRIWVESEVGAGSTFLFTLPQSAPPES